MAGTISFNSCGICTVEKEVVDAPGLMSRSFWEHSEFGGGMLPCLQCLLIKMFISSLFQMLFEDCLRYYLHFASPNYYIAFWVRIVKNDQWNGNMKGLSAQKGSLVAVDFIRLGKPS